MHEMAALAFVGVLLALAGSCAAAQAGEEKKKPTSVLDFSVKDIDGQAVNLSKYQGKVLVVVNTASKCGHTPQYESLQKVYEKYKDQGLAILAFPANEFGQQEPGTNAEIKEFCASRYQVTFDLFSKLIVKGEGQHPLYQFLTSRESNPDFGGAIKWNFTKFLVSRDGKVVARFEPKVKPDDPQVLEAIEVQLAKQ
ncbi:MAG TPA: glutathione peroxidase [Tepidisphaeraceae bacterium]|nr:glutathione peroxidase [Tepidisphaeraceae bacterium]